MTDDHEARIAYLEARNETYKMAFGVLLSGAVLNMLGLGFFAVLLITGYLR